MASNLSKRLDRLERRLASELLNQSEVRSIVGRGKSVRG
jgi:hypothetical protein